MVYTFSSTELYGIVGTCSGVAAVLSSVNTDKFDQHDIGGALNVLYRNVPLVQRREMHDALVKALEEDHRNRSLSSSA
jgi:hypothetical protein